MSKLLGDRILIKQDVVEEKTSSGVYVSRKEETDGYKRGVVAEVGKGGKEGINLVPIDDEIKIGVSVIFQFGNPIIVDGNQYLLVQESDIIRVL